MSAVRLESVAMVAPDGTRILDDVSLEVAQGELLVLVGPSGSGKTSVIRAVAGVDEISSGRVMFDDVDVTKVRIAERDVGMVFQSAALFPTHTVRNNISFPLRIRKVKEPTVRKRVAAEARALGLTEMIEHWPQQLSAGHQQLVQIARAMVRVPQVLLLDEPLAHVDRPTRYRLRADLRQLQQGYGVTTLLATNEPGEAMALADRIAAIEDGRIQQVGPPQDVYAAPADTHIAWLTGPISFIDATVQPDTRGFWLTHGNFSLRAWAPVLSSHVGAKVRIGLRPDGVRMVPSSSTRAVVVGNSFDSGHPVTKVEIGSAIVSIEALNAPPDTDIGIRIDHFLVFGPDDKLIVAVS
ncbi:MAG: ABC transporter ATP-binding protein [Acidimicrobiales bacterium]|nr:ABC transporter ATP-binding protein [Acidimicrobiales bacterium]